MASLEAARCRRWGRGGRARSARTARRRRGGTPTRRASAVHGTRRMPRTRPGLPRGQQGSPERLLRPGSRVGAGESSAPGLRWVRPPEAPESRTSAAQTGRPAGSCREPQRGGDPHTRAVARRVVAGGTDDPGTGLLGAGSASLSGELAAGTAALWCKTAVTAMSRPPTCEATAATRSGDRALKNISERR